MSITVKQLRDAKWREAGRVATTSGEFIVHVCDIDGITLSHDVRKGHKARIVYTIRASGRQFDSPSAAVKHFNACKQQRQGTGHAAGSVEALRAAKGTGGGRRNVRAGLAS